MAQGGKRPGAGRPKGAANKTTADVKALAQVHGPAAIERLAHLMKNAGSEAAQVAAANSLLERAYGKAAQPHVGDKDADPINHVHRIERLIVGPSDRNG